jgi:hypothetical protein
MAAPKSRNLRKQQLTLALMVRSMFADVCGLQDQAAALFGKIRGSRYVVVVTPTTNRFVTEVTAGLGFAPRHRPKVQVK